MSADRIPASRGIASLADIPEGECRHGPPELVIRCKHSVIPVPVLARRRHEIGEPVEKLKRREVDDAIGPWPRGLAAATGSDPVGRLMSRQHVADASDLAVCTAAHRESLERKGWPGAIPQDLYAAALHSDATTLMQRVGFDDLIGRKRFADLINETYLIELKVIVQLVRWYEIGLVKTGEIDVPHPSLLMIDLRRRIQASPNKHVSARPVPAVAPRDPSRSADACRSAIGRPILWWGWRGCLMKKRRSTEQIVGRLRHADVDLGRARRTQG